MALPLIACQLLERPAILGKGVKLPSLAQTYKVTSFLHKLLNAYIPVIKNKSAKLRTTVGAKSETGPAALKVWFN